MPRVDSDCRPCWAQSLWPLKFLKVFWSMYDRSWFSDFGSLMLLSSKIWLCQESWHVSLLSHWKVPWCNLAGAKEYSYTSQFITSEVLCLKIAASCTVSETLLVHNRNCYLHSLGQKHLTVLITPNISIWVDTIASICRPKGGLMEQTFFALPTIRTVLPPSLIWYFLYLLCAAGSNRDIPGWVQLMCGFSGSLKWPIFHSPMYITLFPCQRFAKDVSQ